MYNNACNARGRSVENDLRKVIPSVTRERMIKVPPFKMANGKWPRQVVDRSKDGLIITLT